MRETIAINPGDCVRLIGGTLVGKVAQVIPGFALVDFEPKGGRIFTTFFSVEELELVLTSGSASELD